ncbi:MAG TPA: 3-isopropylmalate dehydratase small subunit [Acetobacteraceae bacterium]|nr:3-isopropylmalate dehydratase small subunit [Acetobacteraceae bacterium]
MSFATDNRIESISGRGITVRGDDIDTDQILPARYLKTITFQGMEAHVFADSRAAARLSQRLHPFDDRRFEGGSILLVNRNFGCGSSREHAPQSLRRIGVRAIIGESFGEIFAGNCVSVGMPCVQANADAIATLQRLNETRPQTSFTLDLTAMTITAANAMFPVALAEGRRQQLIEGTWDPTAVLLAAGDAIEQTLAKLDPATRMSP